LDVMPARCRRTCLSLAALAFFLLPGCGGGDSGNSKLLSRSSASQLRSTLAHVEETVQTGDCGTAQEQVGVLRQQVTSLHRVEPDLKDALTSGVSRLERLVADSCQPAVAETGPTGPVTDQQTQPSDQQQQNENGKQKKTKKEKKNQNGQNQGEQNGGSGTDGSGSSGGTTGSGGVAP
jgi:hypothetical protein